MVHLTLREGCKACGTSAAWRKAWLAVTRREEHRCRIVVTASRKARDGRLQPRLIEVGLCLLIFPLTQGLISLLHLLVSHYLHYLHSSHASPCPLHIRASLPNQPFDAAGAPPTQIDPWDMSVVRRSPAHLPRLQRRPGGTAASPLAARKNTWATSLRFAPPWWLDRDLYVCQYKVLRWQQCLGCSRGTTGSNFPEQVLR